MIQEQQKMMQAQTEAMAKREEAMLQQIAALRQEISRPSPRSVSSRSSVSSESTAPRRVALGGGKNTNRSARARRTPNVMNL